MLPVLSTSTPYASTESRAAVAGPPSPLKPGDMFPTTVVMAPLAWARTDAGMASDAARRQAAAPSGEVVTRAVSGLVPTVAQPLSIVHHAKRQSRNTTNGGGRQNVQKNVSLRMESRRLPGNRAGSGSREYLTSSRFGLRRTVAWRYHSPPTIRFVNGA